MAGRVSGGEGRVCGRLNPPPPQTVTAVPPGPRATPAAGTPGWDAACANPASRAPTASTVPRASTAPAASVSVALTLSPWPWEPVPAPTEHAPPPPQRVSAPALEWWTRTVTGTRAAVPAGRASRDARATAVPRATSTSLSASVSEASPAGAGGCGAGAWPAWLRGPGVLLCSLVCGCSPVGTLPEGCDEAGHCPCRPEFDGPHCDRCRPGHHGYPDCRGEQRAGGARGEQEDLPRAQGLTPCPLQPAPVTLGVPWTSSAGRAGRVTVAQATRAPPARSAAPASTASPTVPVSARAGGREGGRVPTACPRPAVLA